jgi:hypothetical protein
MANTLMSLLVKLGIDSGDFDEKLGETEKQVGKFKSNIGANMASVGNAAVVAMGAMATAAAVGFGAMVKEGVEMNKFLELSELQFETLMGDAALAEKHIAALFKIAAETPFEATDVITASKHLQTFGGTAFNTAENVLMVGDAAAAVGQNMDEVAFWTGRAYAMIQGGQPFGEAAMRLMEMGILSADARTELEALQKSGASADEVWGKLTETYGKFDGAMKKQSRTWEGLTATISDNVKLALGKSMEPLFEVFKTGLERIADFTSSETFTGWLDGIGQVARVAADILEKLFTGDMAGAFQSFKDALSKIAPDWVVDGIQMLADGIKSVFDILKNDSGTVIAIVTTLGLAIAAAAWTAIVPLLPIIATFALVAAAVYLLYTAWTENWGGIQETMAAVWAWLQPTLQAVWDWLQVNLPLALQALAQFWTTTLLPAIQAVGDWITGTLFPALAALWDWLSTNIPAALQALAGFWTNTLLPAVKAVADWFMITLYPFFLAFAAFLNTVFSLALTALAGIWQNVLLPAIQKVAEWLGEKLQPVFQALSDWWNSTGQPIAAAIAEWFGEKIAGAFVTVTSAIQQATGWIIDLTKYLQNIQLPDWMTPGSPTPWEIGLLGINDALKQVSRQGLPDLNMGITATPTPAIGANVQGATQTAQAQSGKYTGPTADDIGAAVARALPGAMAASGYVW